MTQYISDTVTHPNLHVIGALVILLVQNLEVVPSGSDETEKTQKVREINLN